MAAKKTSSRRLAAFVHVNDVAWGPDDEVPADVAALITNPAAWAIPEPVAAPDPVSVPEPDQG